MGVIESTIVGHLIAQATVLLGAGWTLVTLNDTLTAAFALVDLGVAQTAGDIR